MKRLILITWILWVPFHTIFSQSHKSKDNYTGDWESPSSWNPTWTVPSTNIIDGQTVTINGYITLTGSLSFGDHTGLIINDTLVIEGDLTLGDHNILTIKDNGILIIRGNLILGDHTVNIANSYFIITGNVTKTHDFDHGSFTSNDNPEKVFVGGTVTPVQFTDNNRTSSLFNCTSPITIRYPNSKCSYGNMRDILTDPIYPFFQSTCHIATPFITPSGPLTFCSGGSVNLASSSASTYLWSNGATTQNINVNSSGNYWVKVIDKGGCESALSETIVVTVNALPATPTITASGATVFCSGENVTLTSSTGTSYLWSTGAITPSIIVSAPGTYSVRISNANGCQSAVSVGTKVTVNALPAAPTITASGPTTFCEGESVTLTSSSGSTYLWSNGATTRSINVTTAGNYSVRVTNSNGCQSAASAPKSVIVNALPQTPTIAASGPTTFCTGESVNLSSSAGSSYLWSNGATTQSINVSTTGNYSVRITNLSGCQSAVSPATVVTVNTLPPKPNITAGGPTTFCDEGSVTLTSSAGSTYLWSNGATTQSINATTAGNYTVRITNVNGCQSAASDAAKVTVNALPATPTVTASGPTSFCAGGNVTLKSSNGSHYLWSNGATTEKITINATGSFTVIVTDPNGCQSAASTAVPVRVNALPVVNAGTDVTIPNGTSTTLNSTVTGTGPFSYSWSPSSRLVNPLVEDPTTVNLTETTDFTLTVTSASTTCSASDAVTVTTTGETLKSVPTATPDKVCAGSDVQLNAVASGGSGSYTYSWSSTPAGFTSNLANPIVNPSVNTSYNVTVYDGFNTVNSHIDVEVKPLPATPVISAGGPITFCEGGSVTLSSGQGSNYLWSTGETTQSINVTSSGNFSVQVTNSNGCPSIASVPISVTVNDTPVTPIITAGGPLIFCEGGSVTLTSSAGVSYLWSDGRTDPSINVSTTGTFTVQVFNSRGCPSEVSAATSVIVNALPGTPTISADGPVTLCDGENVTLSSSPGTGYIWSNGETTQAINVFTTGNYTVQVTNSSGCQSQPSSVTNITVNSLPATPAITASGPTAFCQGGGVTLTSSSGINYLWSNGETTPAINVSAEGNYSVIVTNSSGCQSQPSAVTNVKVNPIPETPIIIASGPTTFCEGGSVTLTSTSTLASNQGISYLWSSGETSQSINVNRSGIYTVQITDAHGCQSASSVSISVTVNNLPVVTASNNGPVCAGSTLNLAEGSTGMISYLWTGPEGFTSLLQSPLVSPSATLAMAGTYTVAVTAPTGCTNTGSTVVTVNILPEVKIISSGGPMCTNESRDLKGSPEGGTFIIIDGPGSITGNVLTATGEGIINLVYDYRNICGGFSSQNIIANEVPVANAGPDQEQNSVFEYQMQAELSPSGTGEWSLVSGSGQIIDIHSPTTLVTGLSIGENLFLWKVNNDNCEATDEISIVVNDIFAPTVITPNEDGLNDKLIFKGLETFPGSTLIIYNRLGGEVYRSADYKNDWNGKDQKDRDLQEDTYFYILRISDGRILKKFVEIIR